MEKRTQDPAALTRIGFGTYRMDDGNPLHSEALKHALANGCGLIDTSTNYGGGDAESAVGASLRDEAHSPLVISKAGYIQGSLLKEVSRYSEVTSLSGELAHSIHPEFISEMLERSRERLGGGRLEAYLLHNPEYFLKRATDHREYYRRIEAAFHALEAAADAGKIRYFGVSSNTFIEEREHPEFTSLEVLLEIAARVSQTRGTPSRFRYVQFPLNLFESEAVFNANQGNATVLELASREGLTTLTNRPLNAFSRKHLVRLASFRNHHQVDFRALLSRVFDEVNTLETQFPAGNHRPVFWGHLLRENFRDLLDLGQWRNFLNWRIRPSLGELAAQTGETSAGRDWWAKYEPRLEGLLQLIDSFMENQVAERSERLRAQLIQAVPSLRSSPTLSQAALRIYLSIPGVNTVLLGMRTPEYVDDAIQAANSPRLTPEETDRALHAANEFLVEFEADTAVDSHA